jgi:Ca-activated chloride channel family protein
MKTLVSVCLLLLLTLPRVASATGALFVRPLASQQTFTAISIRAYDARVEIQDQIAVTHVDQRFFNTLSSRVESTFIFPLPEGAVITELIYWFNGRKYIASLRERQEAQKQYNDKVRRAIDPALLTYLGDNIFKLNIAPIDAKSEVRFEITYAELLPYDFGNVDYRFLLKTTGLSPEPLERVTLHVDATTTTAFKKFTTPSHGLSTANRVTMVSENHYTADFGDENFIPDRDYLVRFETRRDSVGMNVLTYSPTPADSFGVESFYALWVTPPDSVAADQIQPRDIVVTADVSSSMDGRRIDQLREALNSFLDGLTTNDRFDIVTFGTNVMTFEPDLVAATDANIAAARAFVAGLGAVGLTNIDEALRRSLAMSFADDHTNLLVFLTDGYPTWGQMDIGAIVDSATARNKGRARVFPFGIGDELSRPLLEALGRNNGGYATYITDDDSIAIVVRSYFRRVSQPVLANLSVSYGTLSAFDIYPDVLPDLFWGTQSLQFGRYRNPGDHLVTLSGTYRREPLSIGRMVTFAGEGGNRAVARLWAKYKIDHLLAEIARVGENKELVDAVIDLSIRFGILSPYTAMISDPTEDPPVDPPPPLAAPDETVVALRLGIVASYPNPFTESTRLVVVVPAIARGAHATLTIHDETGRLVRTLPVDDLAPGRHEIEWDGRDDAGALVPAGRYFCRSECAGETATRSIVLVR